MRKLFTLKNWLTIQETAKHLTVVFGEEISEADVLRFALDGHLTLSVNLVNHTRAKVGKVVGWSETKWEIFPKELTLNKDVKTLDTFKDLSSIPANAAEQIQKIPKKDRKHFFSFVSSLCIDITNRKFINLDDKVSSIDGIWDLPMLGSEELDIEHKYQMLTDGPAVTLQNLEGTFLQRGNLTICQLQESFDDNEYHDGSKALLEKIKLHISIDKIPEVEAQKLLNMHKEEREKYLKKRKENPNNDYYPAGGLPDDAVIVVRTDELRRFEHALSDGNQNDRPIKTTERNTLITVIAALCKYEGIDPLNRKTTSEIVQMTEDLGAPVSDDTVRSILQKIPDAVETRKK